MAMNEPGRDVPTMPVDLARAILLADECSPMPAPAVDALRAMRRALAADRGVKVTDLVRQALAHVHGSPIIPHRGAN